MHKFRLSKLFFGALTALTLYLILAPLIMTVVSTFKGKGLLPFEAGPFTLENYLSVFLDANTYILFRNTLIFATGSLIIGFSLSILFSWLMERSDLPLRNLLYALILVPMAIPGMLGAISWILLLSPRIGLINLIVRGILHLQGEGPFNIYTIQGMFFVEGIRMVPTLFLMLSGAFRNMDPSLEEASRVAGIKNLGTMLRITLPIMRPAIIAALIYYLVVAIEAFEIPGIIGINAGFQVFSTQIYWSTHPNPGLPNYGEASTYALIIMLTAIGLNKVYRMLTQNARSFTTVTGKGYRARRVSLGKFRWPAVVIIFLYLIITVALPIFILLWASFQPFYTPPSLNALHNMSFKAYVNVWNMTGFADAIKNSLILCLATATFVMLLVTVLAWMVVRSKFKGRKYLELVTFLPQSMPSIIIGLAVMILYLSFPNPLYGTVWIIMIAIGTKYLAFGSRTMNASLLQIHPELEEASQVSGVSWGTTFIKVLLPLIAPAFINGWIWVAMHALRELSAAMMLADPKNVVVSTLIWQMWQNGRQPEAAVLGLFLVVSLLLLTVLGRVILLRKVRSF